MKQQPTLTLDALRLVAPIVARAVSNVSTYEDHVQAMRELEGLNRRDRMIGAFWAYLSDRAGYTTEYKKLALLTEQEQAQFDKALADIVDRRLHERGAT